MTIMMCSSAIITLRAIVSHRSLSIAEYVAKGEKCEVPRGWGRGGRGAKGS